MHPNIRLPLWLAAALPLIAYAYRAQFMRGGDWRPDLPWDVVAFVMLVVVIVLVGIVRRSVERDSDRDE